MPRPIYWTQLLTARKTGLEGPFDNNRRAKVQLFALLQGGVCYFFAIEFNKFPKILAFFVRARLVSRQIHAVGGRMPGQRGYAQGGLRAFRVRTVWLQGIHHRGSCNFRPVVLRAQMAEPYLFDYFPVEVMGQEIGCFPVAYVSDRAGDAVFQALWIGAVFEHERVIVRFDDQVGGLRHYGGHFFGEMSYVRHHHDTFSLNPDDIAVVVRAVMGHSEGSDFKRPDMEGLVFADGFPEFLRHFLVDEMVAHDGRVYRLGSVDRQVEVVSQYAHTFHVVRMVMSNQHSLDLRQWEAIV